MENTYEIHTDGDEEKAIKCLKCGHESKNPHDIASRYCGACHEFHEGDPILVPIEEPKIGELKGTPKRAKQIQDLQIALSLASQVIDEWKRCGYPSAHIINSILGRATVVFDSSTGKVMIEVTLTGSFSWNFELYVEPDRKEPDDEDKIADAIKAIRAKEGWLEKPSTAAKATASSLKSWSELARAAEVKLARAAEVEAKKVEAKKSEKKSDEQEILDTIFGEGKEPVWVDFEDDEETLPPDTFTAKVSDKEDI